MYRNRRRTAFTLIELLVVIAIIAILAAILFPVFAQAKLAAKKAASVSNSKQVVLANLMYATDYDDIFTFAQPGGWEWTQSWLVNVQPYIKSFQLYMSPADAMPRSTWSGPPFSYPGNGMTCWDWQAGGWRMSGVFNARQSWWLNYTESISQTQIPLVAETIMLGERHTYRPYYNRDLNGAWDLNDIIFYGWNFDLPGQGPLPADQWTTPTNKNGSVTAPYSGVATFSFSDGHTKAMQPLKTIDGSGYNNGNCDSTFFKYWNAKRTQ